MALVIRRYQGQGFRIGEGPDAIWIYVDRKQPNDRQIAILIIAPAQQIVSREEKLLQQGEDPGPRFNPHCYRRDQLD